jgi:hypothetical protein
MLGRAPIRQEYEVDKFPSYPQVSELARGALKGSTTGVPVVASGAVASASLPGDLGFDASQYGLGQGILNFQRGVPAAAAAPFHVTGGSSAHSVVIPNFSAVASDMLSRVYGSQRSATAFYPEQFVVGS